MAVRDRLPEPAGPALEVQRHRVDLHGTPIDALVRLRDRPFLVALIGRWHDGAAVLTWDPLIVAGEREDSFLLADGLPGCEDTEVFGGGWIGAWGYQLGGDLEDLGPFPRRPIPQRPHRLAFYDRVLLHKDGEWWLEQLTGLVGREEEARRGESFLTDLRAAAGRERAYRLSAFEPSPGEREHVEAVRRVQDAIRAGDVFQANVTMRLEAELDGAAVDLFARGWRHLRPQFAAFLGWPDGAVASFSPELFVRRRGDAVLTSPIKGTAPASSDPSALAASVKDQAENVMIVDLMRNDLARVCLPGSVRVPCVNRVETHAVHHLVSDVIGRLRPGVADGGLLRATFPPGSVTGAPKVAALRLLNEVEATARELYTGAIGYLSPAAGAELSVAIRTFELSSGRVWLGVGGGITTLSDPEAELEECYVKAGPLLEAVGGVRRALAGVPGQRDPDRSVVRALPVRRAIPHRVSFPTPHDGRPCVLLLDNYDSFVHNLAHYLEEAGAATRVVRNDALSVEEVAGLRRTGQVTHLLLSPGPGAPDEAGISVPLVQRLGPGTPVLGVCLGHQAIGQAFGGRVVRARRVVHGRAGTLTHDGVGMLSGLPQGIGVARYHSLALDPLSLPEWLEPTSWAEDGELMGVRHRLHPHIEGLQWHPESILTSHGRSVISAFLSTKVRMGARPGPAVQGGSA